MKGPVRALTAVLALVLGSGCGDSEPVPPKTPVPTQPVQAKTENTHDLRD
jgi:hypothetical protein